MATELISKDQARGRERKERVKGEKQRDNGREGECVT